MLWSDDGERNAPKDESHKRRPHRGVLSSARAETIEGQECGGGQKETGDRPHDSLSAGAGFDGKHLKLWR